MGIYDRDHRQDDPWKKNPQNIKQYKLNDFKNINSQKIKENKPVNKWIFIAPIIFFLIVAFFKNNTERLLAETEKPVKNINIQESQNIKPNQTPATQINQTQPKEINQIPNKQIIYRAPTAEEEQAYMQENHLIKLGNEYHWCGIKESRDILPITKALDMNCQNDFCKIQKYYDYVKQIPYEKGTQGKDKNAIEVMEEWKGDCDERSDLLASMMLANGYKTLLLYTKNHTFTALNIPNYESNENRSYVQYEGRKYYIAETTDPNGQIGGYNSEVMHSLKFIYDVEEKRVARGEEIAIQLFK